MRLADGVFRGTKFINLKSIADTAVAKCKERGFDVAHCIVTRNVGDKAPEEVAWNDAIDEWFHELEGSGTPGACHSKRCSWTARSRAQLPACTPACLYARTHALPLLAVSLLPG